MAWCQLGFSSSFGRSSHDVGSLYSRCSSFELDGCGEQLGNGLQAGGPAAHAGGGSAGTQGRRRLPSLSAMFAADSATAGREQCS